MANLEDVRWNLTDTELTEENVKIPTNWGLIPARCTKCHKRLCFFESGMVTCIHGCWGSVSETLAELKITPTAFDMAQFLPITLNLTETELTAENTQLTTPGFQWIKAKCTKCQAHLYLTDKGHVICLNSCWISSTHRLYEIWDKRKAENRGFPFSSQDQ